MISKDLVRPIDRMEPMVLDALERLSFGLEIVVFQSTVLPPGMIGPAAGYGFIYAVKGKLIGKEGWVGNMTFFADPTPTQEEIDRGIQAGLEQVREQLAKQSVLGNGSIPKGPINFNPKEN
jgi:hypothetical protein